LIVPNFFITGVDSAIIDIIFEFDEDYDNVENGHHVIIKDVVLFFINVLDY